LDMHAVILNKPYYLVGKREFRSFETMTFLPINGFVYIHFAGTYDKWELSDISESLIGV
jgi:hypothetical protein